LIPKKTGADRVLSRIEKELQLPRLIRVKRISSMSNYTQALYNIQFSTERKADKKRDRGISTVYGKTDVVL